MRARLLQVANSAALNPNGTRIMELKSAIARIRLSPTCAVCRWPTPWTQIKKAPALQPIRKPLNELWERSVKVAAMAYVVARRWSKVNPDQALLAGLMHGMGRVYILTRAVRHPGLFADADSYQQIVRDWNTPIARAVLESWEIAPDIVEAVSNYEDVERDGSGAPDLTDVLTIANLLVSFHADVSALEIRLQETSASKRFGLAPDACQKAMQETAGELASLRQALGA